MKFFLLTSSGKEGPFDSEALRRQLVEGSVLPGTTVMSADSDSHLPIEEAIAMSKVPTTESGLRPGFTSPASRGVASDNGGEASPLEPVRRPVAPKTRLPRGLRRPLPAPTPKTSRAVKLAFAGSALILFGLSLIGSAAFSPARGPAVLVTEALLSTAAFLAVSAGTAAVFNSYLVGDNSSSNRFAVILLGSTLVLAALLIVLSLSFGRGGHGGSTAAALPPAPILFRDGKFEITPAPDWDRGENLSGELDLIQFFSVSILRIDVIPWTKPGPLLFAGMPAKAWEEAIAPFKGQITWGPQPLTTGSLPALWAGFKSGDEAGRDGIVTVLAAKDSLLVVLVTGTASGLAERRGEIDAMIASIRPR